MRNDTPDDMPPVPESARRQPGWSTPDLTEEERAELARLQARADELTAKARKEQEALHERWATPVRLHHLRYWRDGLAIAAEVDPRVRRVRDLIDTAYQNGMQEVGKAEARAKLAALAEPGEHPLPCAEGEHRWEAVPAKADEVPTSRCTRCTARRLDATPEQLYGRSADR